MVILSGTVLILSCLLLAAWAEQPVREMPADVIPTAAATATPKLAPSNVRRNEETGHSTDSSYYVQNRVLASGGAVSGAIMGS